ncbi:MAG: hypothetical protein JWQ47_873 [Glaciihabitans sp.]|nr:hypothetical protein [Glaciihabitans sp.]
MIKRARSLLIVLLYFGALSAIGGGVLGVVVNGAGVPLEYLRGTPFTSYLIPGLILGVVIGGTQGLAAITTQRQHPYSSIAATVAGFGMIIWIFVELAITGYSWLQTVYFALGVGELLLVMVLLGVLSPTARARRPQ